MSISERIQNELFCIEKEEKLIILLAIESGSRAWGFASPDSDYDVRFIYIRPREYYLLLDKGRDVCEWLLDDILDINGWDLDKTLRLLHSSNPTLFEWLRSPVVYRRHPIFAELMRDADKFFQPRPSLHHYLHMAESNYRTYLKDELVRLKKYFYVLRPILACRHILAAGTPPPLPFRELVDSHLDPLLIPEITELLEIKSGSSEMGLAPQRPRLNRYIEESLAYLREETGKLPARRKQPWQPLNEIFLRALGITGETFTLSPPAGPGRPPRA